ncbi:MAG: enoyl-CoA hydratase-related protein [Polyangiaceae bacterium]
MTSSTASSAPSVKVEVAEGVLTATLAEPERRNVLSPKLLGELLVAFERARSDAAIRVVVLAAEGALFSGGGDLSMMKDAAGSTLRSGFAELLGVMMRSDKPVVAKVQGPALGGGLGLVVASTFALAAEGATFGTPEIDVGLFPMMIMAPLVRTVPRRRLLAMMLTGEKLPASEAERYGIVNEVVPAYALSGKVAELAARLAAKSPAAMRAGLRAYADQMDLGWEESLTMLEGRLREVAATDDAREGIAAFAARRAPVWTGR